MARPSLLLLLLLPIFYLATTTTTTSAAAPTNFIKTSCSATTYPQVCIQTLSSYATSIQQNPRQLAVTALSVSLTRAHTARSFMVKLTKFKGLTDRERGAVKDCLEEMSDGVDRLTKSVEELKGMDKFKGEDFLWHMSNVQTWVSAALTDDTTCLDGFARKGMDGKIKASIRAQVQGVAQCTSNALALCNRFAAKHQ